MAEAPPVISPLLQTMIRVAEQAGEVLLDYFQRPRDGLHISAKKKGDFVSDADKQAERLIANELEAAYPGLTHLGEESGRGRSGDPSRLWIYDPLDGTKNFLFGSPSWSVAIAREENNELVAGVVYAPRLGELFFAEKSQGAWFRDSFRGAANFTKLSVQDGPRIEDGVIDVFPPAKFVGDDKPFFTASGADVRTIGSTCLDMAYVAAGRYQAIVKEAGFGAWDLAAGALLIREAGGVATNLNGDHDFIHQKKKSVVAANPQIHAQLIENVRKGKGNVFSF